MPNTIPKIPAGVAEPAKVYPKPPAHAAATPAAVPQASEHHHAAPPSKRVPSPSALSSTDISYVKSLMGIVPAQKMEEILLKTGVPIPVNLGPNVDTTA